MIPKRRLDRRREKMLLLHSGSVAQAPWRSDRGEEFPAFGLGVLDEGSGVLDREEGKVLCGTG